MNQHRTLLMCPPDFFDIEYEINPWMHQSDQVDHSQAVQQWQALKLTYENLGCQVDTINPIDGWPDMVFTANAGLTIGPKQFILAKFRYPERQGEEPLFKEWLEKRGWQVTQLSVPFEGQGEAFLWRDKILAGYGFRSNEHTSASLSKASGKEVVPLELIDPRFYHLDMALAPIDDDLIVYNPSAFSPTTKQTIQNLGAKLIECSPSDAENFGCNLVRVDQTIVMIQGTQRLANDLKTAGFQIIELDMSQFRKSGGGVRCLTLDI